MTSTIPNQRTVVYPESDGNPMADNTKQFRWIVTIKENLELLFADQADVFVAGDLLWYPVEGDNKIRQAPDTLVVFGRSKGDRGSYRQWEEDNIPPQVVFEILSPGNRLAEMIRKFKFYEQYGVQEYYVYNPDSFELTGWVQHEGDLSAIDEMNGWISPQLQIRFVIEEGTELEIYRPDGRKFLTTLELEERAQEAETKAQEAETKAQEAETKAQEAETKAQAAEQLLTRYHDRFGDLE